MLEFIPHPLQLPHQLLYKTLSYTGNFKWVKMTCCINLLEKYGVLKKKGVFLKST